MISKLYRSVWLGLRRFLPRRWRNKITRAWLAKAKALTVDAEKMSPVPLAGPNPCPMAMGSYSPPTETPKEPEQ